MSIDQTIAKQAIHDQLQAKASLAEASLQTVKARAEEAKATLQIKAIAALFPKTQLIRRELENLKQSNGSGWDKLKTGVEHRIAELENAIGKLQTKTAAR
jgi:outer membrane protein TolC